MDEFGRKGIKADHTLYSTMQNLTQNVICDRRDLQKLVFCRHVLKDWRRCIMVVKRKISHLHPVVVE